MVEVEEGEVVVVVGEVSGGLEKADFLCNSLKAPSVLANESNYRCLFLPTRSVCSLCCH